MGKRKIPKAMTGVEIMRGHKMANTHIIQQKHNIMLVNFKSLR